MKLSELPCLSFKALRRQLADQNGTAAEVGGSDPLWLPPLGLPLATGGTQELRGRKTADGGADSRQ